MSGSVRGRGTTECMAEIPWHHRETRWQTEKTNIGLQHRESPVYSTRNLYLLSFRWVMGAVGTSARGWCTGSGVLALMGV